jgi:hypothetical protein
MTTTKTTDHGLTHEQVSTLADGATVWFTNHPCREAVEVTYIRGNSEGNIRFPDGYVLSAFADELSMAARSGLGA